MNADAFQINLANLSPQDLKFLKSVIGVFADPANADLLQSVRSGDCALQYCPADGGLAITALGETVRSTPIEVIQFVSQFSDMEWDTLIGSKSNFAEISRTCIPLARIRAQEILGYLPKAQSTEIGNG